MNAKAEQTSWLKNSKLMRWVRSMYDWVMGWADHPYGVAGLAMIATIEAIFFPIPVDPLLIAMGASKPKRALWFGGLATFFSVLGALIGYAVGFMFWDASQAFFFQYVFPQDKMEFVLAQFQANTFWAIFIASFTPIPFKVFTIAGGVASLNLPLFLFAAVLGRGARFFLISGLLYFFGPQIKAWIDKYFEKITVAVGVIIVVAVIIAQVFL